MHFDAPAPRQFESMPCHELRTPWSLQTSVHCAYKVLPARTDAVPLRTMVPANLNWGRSAWLNTIDFKGRTHYEAPAAKQWPSSYQHVYGDIVPRPIFGTRNDHDAFLWTPTNANE